MKAAPERDYKLFSIVIASYNHDKYVIECLNSIKAQDYPYIELIVIDDCSIDATYQMECEWLEENREKFHNSVLLKNDENRGVVKTMNRGLEICTGDYILRFASDDCLLPGGVRKIVTLYTEYPQFGMICFNGYFGTDFQDITTRTDTVGEIYADKDYNKIKNPFEAMYQKDYIAAPGCIIQRETYLTLGLCDENTLIEDWEYNLRIMKSMPVLFSSEKVVFIRQEANSLSRSPSISRRKMMNQGTLYVLEKYKNDVSAKVYKETIYEKANLVLRETLEWDDPEFLDYVLTYMNRNQVRRSIRAEVKLVLWKARRCIRSKNKIQRD